MSDTERLVAYDDELRKTIIAQDEEIARLRAQLAEAQRELERWDIRKFTNASTPPGLRGTAE